MTCTLICKSRVVEIEKGDPTRVLWPLIRPLLLGHLRTRSVGDAVADTFYGTLIQNIHEIGDLQVILFEIDCEKLWLRWKTFTTVS